MLMSLNKELTIEYLWPSDQVFLGRPQQIDQTFEEVGLDIIMHQVFDQLDSYKYTQTSK